MQAFLDVAHLSSFTRAAERLHVSQSALSAMMQDLESQLGCRLFDRTTRSVKLTAAGLELLPVATQVLAQLSAVADTIDQLESRARRLLTVGVTPLIAASVMPAACTTFRKLHPDINLRMRDLDRQRIQAGVASGELDVGFGVFFEPASGIEATVIAEFSMAHISPATSSVRRAKAVAVSGKTKWAALREENLIGLPVMNAMQQMIESRLRDIGRANEDRPTYENLQTILAMVNAGHGTAVLPTFVLPACRAYRLQVSILEEPEVPLSFYQITRKGSIPMAATPSLADAIRDSFQAA